jgi:hypothetical protein
MARLFLLLDRVLFVLTLFYVHDVSLIPDLTMQLMSVGQITNHEYHVILDPDFYYI